MAPRSWMTVWSQAVQACRTRRPAHGVRLALEPLEDRRTPTSVSLVKDILAGAGSSIPQNLVSVNGILFFSASDGTNGEELWKSDGTAAGTVLVKDIGPGPGSSNPSHLTVVNGTLFFRADDGTNGEELWKSDGTTAGTVLVKDIYPGTRGSDPFELSDVNGTLFFSADDGTNSVELWKSDGTVAGTILVKDIYPGADRSFPSSLTSVNGAVFFSARDGINGIELWKSDGTEAGTVLVANIASGVSSSFPTALTNVNGILFFSANDGTSVFKLWKSDGTAAGTVLLQDARPVVSSSPSYLTGVNGTLFFRATSSKGVELWKSDGTAAGTVLVKDIRPGIASSYPNRLIDVNGTLFFRADDGTNGNELWKSDGTEAGTVLVKDIRPGIRGSYVASSLTDVNGMLYFHAIDGINGDEVWKSDGTEAGTVLVQDIFPGARGSYPTSLTNVGDIVFFRAADGTSGSELWKVDDTIPPETSITSTPPAFSNTSSPTFEFTATDNGPGPLTFEYRLDSGVWTPTASPLTLTGLADGSHTFEVRAIDASDNVDPTPESYRWTIDTTKPGITIDPPSQDYAKTGDSVTFRVTYSDLNLDTISLDNLDITVNGNGATGIATVVPVTATEFDVQISNLAGNGTIGISIAAGTAVDKTGNVADVAGPSATFTVDNIKPIVTIGPPSVTSTYAGPVSWIVTITEANLPPTFLLNPADVGIVYSTPAMNGTISIVPLPTPSKYRLTLSNFTGGVGTVQIRVNAGAVVDLANNASDATPLTSVVKIIGRRVLIAGHSIPPIRLAPGATQSYTITGVNIGTQMSLGTALVVKLPAYATFVAGASTPGWVHTGRGFYRLDVGNLAAKAKVTAKFVVKFSSSIPLGTRVSFTSWITDTQFAGKLVSPRTSYITFGTSRSTG